MTEIASRNGGVVSTAFNSLILNWFDEHGRMNLPWQQNITPYCVWVSEIMLQQTQVKTVIPYFLKFMSMFPTLDSLAQAHLDEVLYYWSGLGYYTRARNLHKTAQQLCETYSGVFPQDVNILATLPGIGLSTAGAILSIAFDTPAVVLDGNVKRVLIRYQALSGYPEQAPLKKKLWLIAHNLLPKSRGRDYSQAMMDLGAMICTRHNPNCEICPIQLNCQAKQKKAQSEYPMVKPKKALPTKNIALFIIHNHQGEVLLKKVVDSGIWNQLWIFPDDSQPYDLIKMMEKCQLKTMIIEDKWPVFKHTFTHFHLNIEPVVAITQDDFLEKNKNITWDSNQWRWAPLNESVHLGMPLPMKKIWKQLITAQIYSQNTKTGEVI